MNNNYKELIKYAKECAEITSREDILLTINEIELEDLKKRIQDTINRIEYYSMDNIAIERDSKLLKKEFEYLLKLLRGEK